MLLSKCARDCTLPGYRDAEGTWHWFGEAVETDAQQKAEDALKSYAIVQYDQLFGNDRG